MSECGEVNKKNEATSPRETRQGRKEESSRRRRRRSFRNQSGNKNGHGKMVNAKEAIKVSRAESAVDPPGGTRRRERRRRIVISVAGRQADR